MIKTVEVDSVEAAMELVADQEFNTDLQRIRSAYFYRGMPDASYRMTTSIYRNCKELCSKLEPAILRNFTKYASIEDPTLSQSVWKQMIVGQHHGLPTRLLDWTHSPLIALHFANTEMNFEKFAKRDSVVWRIDMRDLNRNLPEKYREKLDSDETYVFTVDSLTSLVDSLEEYDVEMGSKAFASIEPPSVDQRIISQYSFFSIIPAGIIDVADFLDKNTEHTVKYVIKKEIRWKIRDMLDQFNISERIIYPGLDGLSKSLARHYFVKEK